MNAGGDMIVDEYLHALLDGTASPTDASTAPTADSPSPAVAIAIADDVKPMPVAIAPAEPTVAAPVVPEPTMALVPPSQPARTPAAIAPPASAPQPKSATAASQRWLRTNIGDDSYALELLRVQEVLRPAPIVAMRGAAPYVLGVMNLRGRVVPVFDLGVWLGTSRVQPDERSRIVVVERNDELIGALVSAVEDVVTLGRDRVEPPLPGSDPGAMVGIARVGAVPTVLLDANALFG